MKTLDLTNPPKTIDIKVTRIAFRKRGNYTNNEDCLLGTSIQRQFKNVKPATLCVYPDKVDIRRGPNDWVRFSMSSKSARKILLAYGPGRPFTPFSVRLTLVP